MGPEEVNGKRERKWNLRFLPVISTCKTGTARVERMFDTCAIGVGGPSLNLLSHCRLARLDVVVHAEEVGWVVFVFQGNEPVIIRAVGGSREGVSFVRNVVDIRAGQKVRPHRFP